MNEIWKYTLSRSTVCASQMHMVLTPLSWSFLVDKELFSSNNVSKCLACWKREVKVNSSHMKVGKKDNGWRTKICITNRSIVSLPVQYLRQVHLTSDRMNYLCKWVNVTDFLLKFLQSSRAFCRYQINLVKNYNVLKQAAKLLALQYSILLREIIIKKYYC